MATLDVTYFTGTGRLTSEIYGRMMAGETKQVAISGTSAQSPAAPNGAAFAFVHTDTDCRVTGFSDNPTASLTHGRPLMAGDGFEIECRPGEKIAVITLAFA